MTNDKEESKFTLFIRSAIETSDKNQRELADLVGYNNPNMIAQLKVGRVKLALDRVPAMATALKINQLDLFKIALTQFYDEATCSLLLNTIEAGISPIEREILEIVRNSSNGVPKLTDDRREKLGELFA